MGPSKRHDPANVMVSRVMPDSCRPDLPPSESVRRLLPDLLVTNPWHFSVGS